MGSPGTGSGAGGHTPREARPEGRPIRSAKREGSEAGLMVGGPGPPFPETEANLVYRDLPPKKWTGLCRSALGLGWADVAQG